MNPKFWLFCHRKMWLFSHSLSALGRTLSLCGPARWTYEFFEKKNCKFWGQFINGEKLATTQICTLGRYFIEAFWEVYFGVRRKLSCTGKILLMKSTPWLWIVCIMSSLFVVCNSVLFLRCFVAALRFYKIQIVTSVATNLFNKKSFYL